jgi:hypothetical protein
MDTALENDLPHRAIEAVRHASSLRQTAKGLEFTHPSRMALVAVKNWQATRLAATYADLLADPRYMDAANFFLHDIYGASDLSARDEEIKRMLPSLVRLLPKAALRTVVEALEMDALSEQLDHDLAAQLALFEHWSRQELKISYETAYRNMPGSDRRYTQIAMVTKIGTSLDKLVRQPLLGGLLGAMAGPAKMAGLSSVYDFLWRGFCAFKKMKGANEFLQIIQARETAEDRRLRSANQGF